MDTVGLGFKWVKIFLGILPNNWQFISLDELELGLCRWPLHVLFCYYGKYCMYFGPILTQFSNTVTAQRTILSVMLCRFIAWVGESCCNDNSDNGFALVDHVSCYMTCTTQPACQSLNYNLSWWQELTMIRRIFGPSISWTRKNSCMPLLRHDSSLT